jgi:bifunctional non-homologous end joining protein LigD
MHPTLVAEPPEGPDWLLELKWDGVRVLALRTGGDVRLLARSGGDVTRRYPEVATALAALPGGDLALDGEIVVLDDDGRANFARLQHRMHLAGAREIAAAARVDPVTALVFDALVLDCRDLRGLALLERKARLRVLLPTGEAVRFCDHVEGWGRAFLAAVERAGVEGIVAKRAASRYRAGRSRDWVKIKCQRTGDFVIGGWTDPQGERAHLGAVHLGFYEDDALVYAGRAGSGLDARGLDDLAARLAPLATSRCPFARGEPPRGRMHHWVRPELVCAVRFGEWTSDGRLRHPVFVALSPGRDPREVRRIRPRS